MRLLLLCTCIYRVKTIFILFLALFPAFGGSSLYGQQVYQPEALYVKAFTNDDGLRQSMVSQVCQDERGLVWMVTGDGLHYFDGQEFKAFRVPYTHVYNQTDNVMRYLAVVNPGNFLLTSTSSLLQFNTANSQFKSIYRKDGIYPIILNAFIDSKPIVWIHGMNFCLVENGKLIRLKISFDDGLSPPDQFVPSDAARVVDDEILITGEQGLIALRLSGRISGTHFRAAWIPVKDCRNIAKTRLGKTLVLAGTKIYSWQGGGKLTLYADTRIEGLKSMYTDSRDNIWLINQGSNKIYCMASGKIKEINLYTQNGKSTELLSPSIISIYEDSEHNLWFGTDGSGVLVYSPGLVQFQKSNIGFIRCMTVFNNSLWAGTFNNGLWQLSLDLGNARRVNPRHFGNDIYFLDLAADKLGRLWIVTRNGVEVISSKAEMVWQYPLSCLNAKFINQGKDSLLLVYDNHLLRFRTSPVPVCYGSDLFLPARSFVEWKGHYWIGSADGLFRYETKNGLLNPINFYTKSNRVSTVPVYGMLVHQGLLWAATGNGLRSYQPDGKLSPNTAGNGLMNDDVVYAVLPDNQGRLWFTGNNGLGCYLPAEKRVIRFNTKNNLQSLEFNYNAACSNGYDQLYFGGIQGINHIDPLEFTPGKKAPSVQLISLTVSDTAFTPGIPPANPVFKLSRLAPHISGKVFSTNYLNAGSFMFSFLLKGYQADWSKPVNDPSFTYRNLPPGKYQLYVKCADMYLNWSQPRLLLSFTITPPFYATWWFMAVAAISLVILTMLVVKQVQRMQYQSRIREMERQYAIEKERSRISKDMHDEVGASLTRISILSELAKKQREPERAQQLIDQISEISGGVVDEMSEIIWAMNPRNDTLDSFTSYIRQHASSYLESAEIEGVFAFPAEIPSLHMSSELRRNLFLTVKEAFHNIVKHSGAGKVHMSLFTEKGNLRIVIEDNGVGFNIEQISGWGNGLTNMHKRIEELGGSFNIKSGVGSGTTIEFSVKINPKDNSH